MGIRRPPVGRRLPSTGTASATGAAAGAPRRALRSSIRARSSGRRASRVGIVGCLGRFVLGLEFAETVFDLRQAVHGLIGFHSFCIKEFNRGRIPDFCKTVVVHLLPEHDDFTVQFMPKRSAYRSSSEPASLFVRRSMWPYTC